MGACPGAPQAQIVPTYADPATLQSSFIKESGGLAHPHLTESGLLGALIFTPPSSRLANLSSSLLSPETHASLAPVPAPFSSRPLVKIKRPKQGSEESLFRSPSRPSVLAQYSPRLGCRAAGLARPGRLCRTGLSKGPAEAAAAAAQEAPTSAM